MPRRTQRPVKTEHTGPKSSGRKDGYFGRRRAEAKAVTTRLRRRRDRERIAEEQSG